MTITGRAPELTFERSSVAEAKPKPSHVDTRHGSSQSDEDESKTHVGHIGEVAEFEATIRTPPQRRNNYQWVVMKTEATSALAQAGFKSRARALVEQAAANAPPDITLEGLIRAALSASR